jgi:hypothetical protein
MPSHLSSIGMPVKSQEDFRNLVERIADSCASIDLPHGRYLHWASKSGAELWLQVDANNDFVGMTPHFSGESVVRVGLTQAIARPDETGFDGGFQGWAAPASAAPESGCYPFVFDAPDFRIHDHLQLPARWDVQIAAFAHEIKLFHSSEAYAASQTSEIKFASQSFIPSGLFLPDGAITEPPEARAIFTGHIRRTECRTNDLTSHPFWWALVETLGGVFDVVIDSELAEHPPVWGGVLSGAFWLSGRLIKEYSVEAA